MNNVNKTLYIPLFSKAYVSKRGLFIEDEFAEKIWNAEGFELKGKAKSKWLSYYLGIRARVFDDWVKDLAKDMPGSTVIHIGCGLDSRAIRVGDLDVTWYDVDFPEVIEERQQYFEETEKYKMIKGDARHTEWLGTLKGDSAIVVMEGISMYLSEEELLTLFSALSERFEHFALLMDCYSVFAAKMSKYKNPINEVGVTKVFGIDNPKIFAVNGINYTGERDMSPLNYVNELAGFERKIFKGLYAGKAAKKLYRLYEYVK